MQVFLVMEETPLPKDCALVLCFMHGILIKTNTREKMVELIIEFLYNVCDVVTNHLFGQMYQHLLSK